MTVLLDGLSISRQRPGIGRFFLYSEWPSRGVSAPSPAGTRLSERSYHVRGELILVMIAVGRVLWSI
jgi:hypothetical protein